MYTFGGVGVHLSEGTRSVRVVTPSTEALNFKVSAALKTRLREYADRNGVSVSDAVRLLLTRSLNQDDRAVDSRPGVAQ